jgi:hypothetical protein
MHAPQSNEPRAAVFDSSGTHRVDFRGVECFISDSLSFITNVLLLITHGFGLPTKPSVTTARSASHHALFRP